MKVSELFEEEKITKEMVLDTQGDSDYSDKATSFVVDNWDRAIESMTPKQAQWLDKIHEDFVEKRIEGKL